jgi:hypothetical protein
MSDARTQRSRDPTSETEQGQPPAVSLESNPDRAAVVDC